MTFLQVNAAGHALLIEAARVDRIADRADGVATLDLCARLGGTAAGGVVVICLEGPALAVESVGTLLDLPDADMIVVPWLPAAAAALVDAVGAGRWRLRTGLTG